MFFYILYGRYPFRGKSNKLGSTDQELYKNIAKANLIQPERFNTTMKDIFNKFFKVDEAKRCSAYDILKLDYFRFH